MFAEKYIFVEHYYYNYVTDVCASYLLLSYKETNILSENVIIYCEKLLEQFSLL